MARKPLKNLSIYRQVDDQSIYLVPSVHSSKAIQSAWARLIAKVYEIDPLVCPRCGAEMKILAVITDSFEVKKILKHPNWIIFAFHPDVPE